MKLLVTYGLVAIMLSATNKICAQDAQFSQFYAAPMYLNPALAGSGDTKGRMGVNYRNQWPNKNSNSFQTVLAHFDYSPFKSGFAFGFVLNQQKENLMDFTSLEIGSILSHKLKVARGVFLGLGTQVSYFQKHVNFDNLIYGNQIDIINGQVIGPSGEPLNGEIKVGFSSLSFGGILYSENFWLGAAAHHINQPNQSFTDTEKSKLATKLSIHMGYILPFLERKVNTTLNYKSQGGFNQFDANLGLQLHPQVLIGAGYRGINEIESLMISTTFRVAQNSSSNNPNATHNTLSFGYSYDYTLSKLRSSTSGAHEFTLILTLGKNKRDHMKCPIEWIR